MNVLNVVEFLALIVVVLVLVVKVSAHVRRHNAEVNALIRESREFQAAREYHPSRWNR